MGEITTLVKKMILIIQLIVLKVQIPMNNYNLIKTGNISIEKIQEDQKQFKSKVNGTTTGNPKHKSKDQSDTIRNLKNLYN